MSMVDLGYMQTMAGSSKNIHKKKIINEMPKWMRPSGEFGIGLHSAFLLTKDLPVEFQSIKFNTYSYFSHECLDVEMFSPLGGKQGYCFITKNIGGTRKIGTETKFYIKVNFDLEKIEGDQDFNFINIDAFEKKWGAYEKETIYEKILKNAPICTLGFSKKLISDVIWDKEKQVAFYIKNSIEDDADDIRSFFFKGQKVEINNYREYGLFNCSYLDYMVDIYGVSAKKVLNISRDYWDSYFENRHSEYLKDLFEKHISKIQKFETDLLKLTYCIDYEIDFKLSEHWLNGSVSGRKISDVLNEVGFYILHIDGSTANQEDRKAHLRSNFNNYITLESESDNDVFMVHALKNYCEKYGYNRYILRLDDNFHRYPEEVGLTFYSKNIQPIDLCKEYKWGKSEFYYSSEIESKNVFEELWDNLIRECQFEGYCFHSKYLNLMHDKINLLEEYKKLSFRFRDYWDDLLIISPYQVLENEIKILNLDDLSVYVANRKNDLSNVKEYKRLYEKLIIEIDKYKKTPH